MPKPSIFSRDYERKMRKRRLKIAGVVIFIIIASGFTIYNVNFKGMSITQIKNKLQDWVNNSTPQNQEKNEEPKKNKEEVTKPIETPKNQILNVALDNNEKIKLEYKDIDNKKEFVENMQIQGYSIDVSLNREEAIICSENQEMYLINTDGDVKNVTKNEYTAKSGTKFWKVNVLKEDKEYIWGVSPKFIDNDMIVYVSNLPYFNTTSLNQYIWMYNIKTNKYGTVWKSKGKNIQIGKINGDKGINISIDGNEYILTKDGKLNKE